MGRTWTVPASYTYDAHTTLKSLLATFMEANRGATTKHLATALKVSADIVSTWMQGTVNVALTTRYKTAFEEITGIDLDRLLVIQAKQEILRLLEDIEEVRRENPSLAWMLGKDPDLARKVDFHTLCTRQEMIAELKKLSDTMSGGLISIQLGVDNAVFNAWCSEKRNFLPSGESLVRMIIMMSIGLVQPDAQDPVGRDEIRYHVIAERVLGADPRLVLGAATFQEALDQLFEGLGKYAISVKTSKTGLTQPTVRRLQDWDRGDGRTSTDVIVQVLRKLFEKRYSDHLEAFDRAAQEIKDKKKKRVDHPVFWHRVPATTTPPPEEQMSSEGPPPPPKRRAVPRPPATQLARAEEEKREEAVPPVANHVPEVVLIAFAGTLAQIREALRLYPQLREQLPTELKPTPPKPQDTGTLWEMDLVRRALRGNRSPHTPELEAAVIRRIEELEPIIRMVCNWPPEVRSRILNDVDQPLLNIADLFDALGLADPQEFIERMSPQRDAASLAPKG